MRGLFPEWPALAAIAIWASLATVAGGSLRGVSPAALFTVALATAAVCMALVERLRGRSIGAMFRPRARDALLVAYGMGLYHALLFVAFDRAPLVEANLLNYLWPLLTVLFAAPICGERLSRRVVAGAVLGFAGAALVIGGSASIGFSSRSIVGYACATAAAICWASFTNLLKARPLRSPAFPLGTALSAALGVAWMAASGASPPGGASLASAVYLGALPMGLATPAWELGIRRGRVSVVGALAYLTPLLSTLGVCAVLHHPLSKTSAIGGVLILLGAILGSARRTSRA